MHGFLEILVEDTGIQEYMKANVPAELNRRLRDMKVGRVERPLCVTKDARWIAFSGHTLLRLIWSGGIKEIQAPHDEDSLAKVLQLFGPRGVYTNCLFLIPLWNVQPVLFEEAAPLLKANAQRMLKPLASQGLNTVRNRTIIEAVSYTHLTLPTNREV